METYLDPPLTPCTASALCGGSIRREIRATAVYMLTTFTYIDGGAVDRRGQQNTASTTLVDLTKRFEVQCNKFNNDFDRAYKSFRHLDLEIWRFSCWQQTDKLIALPLAVHACAG
jgi:hypothetical protein